MGKKIYGQLGSVFATWISVIFILALLSFVFVSTHLISSFGESSARFNEAKMKAQALDLLSHTASVESCRCAAAFQQAESLTVIMAQTAGFFLEQKDVYGRKNEDSQQNLTLFPNKIYSNSAEENVNVIYTGGTTISEPLQTQINSLSHIDKLLSVVKRSSPYFASSWVSTREGVSLSYPNRHFVSVLPSVEKHDYSAANTNQTGAGLPNPVNESVWTKVFKDVAGQGLIIAVSTPIIGAGNTNLGTAGIDITMDGMSELLMSIEKDHRHFSKVSGSFHFLVDGKGNVIAMPANRLTSFGFDSIDSKRMPAGELLSMNLRKSHNTHVQALSLDLLNSPVGTKTINLDGLPFVVSYITIEGTPWSLVVAISEEELFATVHHSKEKINSTVELMSTRFILITIVFLLLMIGATTFLFYTRLLTPVRKLTDYTKRIAEGKLEQQVEVEGGGEISELAVAFNQMARDLLKTTVSRDILTVEVGERKKAEIALRESEEKVRNIIENSTNLFYSHTVEHALTYLSPQTVKFLDCQPQECMELWMNTVTDNPLNTVGFESTQKAIDTGEKQPPFELELIGKMGRKIWVEVNEQPVVIDGETTAIVGALTDITERKREEQRRQLIEAQLHHAQKIESVGRLAGGVAHDFNNMLSVILGNTEILLKAGHKGDASFDYLAEIQTAAQHSAELTQQLLAFARKQPTLPQVLDLNDAVEDTLKLTQRLIGENIDLIWEPAARLWPVVIDPSQISQILVNLCLNARDAIDGAGVVHILTENITVESKMGTDFQEFTSGDYVLLTLSDNGCGIDEGLKEKLFEPFFTTKDVGKGTGLGLSTIYGIIKQNNGFVGIESESGKGTTFSIYFPRCTKEELRLFHEEQVRSKGNISQELVADENSALSVPKQETILLVEDEPAILKMTTMVLEMEGFTVVSASSPSKAVDLVKELSIPVDLLMTDVIMPEMNGLELSKILLALIPGLKVLYMSGYTADVLNNEVVLDKGATFIQKPFDIDELVVIIRKVLDS